MRQIYIIGLILYACGLRVCAETGFTVKTGHAAAKGRPDDLFQSPVVRITAGSSMHSGASIQDLFTQGTPIKGDGVIFQDVPDSLRYYVEFRTAGPVEPKEIVIGFTNDYYPAPQPDKRAASGIRIFAAASAADVMDSLVADIKLNPEYTDAYGDRAIAVHIPVDAGLLRHFRIEFVGAISGDAPRVMEIDAFGNK